MDFDEALDAFVRGMAYERSFTRPVEVVQLGPVIVARDSPPRKRDPRLERFTVGDVDPAVAVDIIQKYKPSRWSLTVINRPEIDPSNIKAAYKARGYRQISHLPLYFLNLPELNLVPSQADIVRVTTPSQSAAVEGGWPETNST